jgi:hypothetical protein
MREKHTKSTGFRAPNNTTPTPPLPPPPTPPADKKIHTAGLGFVLLVLTNYQAEVKQIVQAILKWIA